MTLRNDKLFAPRVGRQRLFPCIVRPVFPIRNTRYIITLKNSHHFVGFYPCTGYILGIIIRLKKQHLVLLDKQAR